MDSSMVQQLQAEVSLLVRELTERDRELNSMVLSHQQQLSCWNRDREATLLLREQLTLSEERSMATKLELRHAQASLSEQIETLGPDRTRREQLESSLVSSREENEQLSISLRSAESRIAELASNEEEMRNALKQALEGESAEQEGCLQELSLIRAENEQLREETNSSRERSLQLCGQIEALWRQLDRERETAGQEQIKLHNSISTLERQLEVYRVAEERKSRLLASYRAQYERVVAELRATRELLALPNGHNSRPVSNGHSSPIQVRPDILSPQRPTRDLSPSSPLGPQRNTDDPFPGPPSPVSPSLRRPCTLGIIRDQDETDLVISEETERVCCSFELKLDTLLHSIDPPAYPWQQRSLSVIPEEETDPVDSKHPPDTQ